MPNPYINQGVDMQSPEAEQILRQKQMAQQLMSQSQQQLPSQMISGHLVAPSWTQQLAQGLQGFLGRKDVEMADKAMQDLRTEQQGQRQEEMKAMVNALRGTPEKTISAPSPFDQGEPAGQFTMPAKAGSVNDAYALAMQSKFPEMQQFGMQGAFTSAQEQAKLLQQQQQQQKLIAALQGAKTPQDALSAGVPAAMVKDFYESGNWGKEKGVVINGQLANPLTGDLIGKPVPQQPNMATDLLIPDPANPGKFIPNAALVSIKGNLAEKSRPQVNVNTKVETKAAENLAGKVGDILEKSSTSAQGAAQVSDAADRVIGAVQSGKLIAGPFANGRLSLAQAAETLGIPGNDRAEVIANTRQAIRGLSEMTLQGRKQMSGQGAITESESKLAEKANSGDISDLTAAELVQLAQASKRASEWMMANHQAKLDAAAKLPAGKELLPFYSNVTAPSAPKAPAKSKPATVSNW